jgi:hypothetical protein
MAANGRKTKRDRRWQVWYGDVSSIRAISRIVVESMEARKREIIEAQSKAVESLRAKFDPEVFEESQTKDDVLKFLLDAISSADSIDEIRTAYTQQYSSRSKHIYARGEPDFIEYLVQLEKLKDLESLNVEDVIELTVVDRNEEVFGPTRSVLEEMDRRSTLQLHFYVDGLRSRDAGFRYLSNSVSDGIYVRIGSGSSRIPRGFVDDSAVEISVTSPSAGWARATFSHLCDEIDKGVPRWSFLRKQGYQALLQLIIVLVPTSAVAIAVPKSEWVSTIYLVGSIIGISLVLSGALRRLMDWMLLAFEITQDGGQPSGTRRLVALLGILVTIPIGIFVNLIT